MQLTFERVSFTYNTQAARQLEKQAKKRRRSTVVPTNSTPDIPWALQDISFSLNEGDFLGIAGHTGSGKSTLLQHLNGLLDPTLGCVYLNDANLTQKETKRQCRCLVGMLFQYPERQLFANTVFDDVAFGPRNIKLCEEEVNKRVCRSLEAVGFECDSISALSPFELSGGQQRRVAFAGVIAMNPRVLVLDEPTAGLDPEAKRSFLQLIDRIHSQGTSIVMASHNMEDLARYCNKIVVLHQGHIALEGTPEQVFSNENKLRAIGLDIPLAQQIANELRTRGVRLPQKLFVDENDLAQACASLYKHTTRTQNEPPTNCTQASGKQLLP